MGSDWETVTLKSICERIVDCPHSTPKWTDSGVIVVRSPNIKGGRLDLSSPSFTDEEHYEQRSKRANVQPGDLIITREAPMGEVCMVPDGVRCCLGQRMVLLRPDRRKCDACYLLFALQSPSVQHEIGVHKGTGSTVSNLRIPALKALPIPLPALPEQRAIAGVLGSLDDKIELNRRTNRTLEAMAQALFKSWFVDFDPVHVNANAAGQSTRPPDVAALFPAEFEPSPIGDVPKGWVVQPLGELLSVLETGRRPKGGVSKYRSGVPSIGAESIRGIGEFDFGKTKFVPIDFYEKTMAGRVEHNDVLLYKDGGKPGVFKPRVGMFGFDFPFDRFCINEHVFRLRSDVVGQVWLYFTVSCDRVLGDYANKGGKAAIPGINQRDVKSVLIATPSKAQLDEFEHLARPLCDQIVKNASQSRTLADLRSALLPKLLSGVLSLSAAEEAFA